MEYKRLTDKRLAIPKGAFRQAKSKEEYLELARTASKTDNAEIYNRLAELENKIEQGKLIELPCKVGDTVYLVYSFSGICEWEVDEIVIMSRNLRLRLTHKGTKDYNFALLSEKGETLFFTREEAEKRLKELQECIKQ